MFKKVPNKFKLGETVIYCDTAMHISHQLGIVTDIIKQTIHVKEPIQYNLFNEPEYEALYRYKIKTGVNEISIEVAEHELSKIDNTHAFLVMRRLIDTHDPLCDARNLAMKIIREASIYQSEEPDKELVDELTEMINTYKALPKERL